LTWRELLARHADVLLCADLFTKEIWTFCGLRRGYVFFAQGASFHEQDRCTCEQRVEPLSFSVACGAQSP